MSSSLPGHLSAEWKEHLRCKECLGETMPECPLTEKEQESCRLRQGKEDTC